MLNFIKITTSGDLKWLGRCLDPKERWQIIHSEYTELSADAQSSRALELAKQITFLTNKINITNSIVEYLYLRGPVDSLIKELQQMGYRLKYTDLITDLNRTLTMSKSDHVKLANAKEQYGKLGNSEKATEFSWYQVLAALAKHRGVMNINPTLISVTEFVAMDREMREYVSMMNKMVK